MGKAVVITTREFLGASRMLYLAELFLDSMEEASALANKAGILATRMLG